MASALQLHGVQCAIARSPYGYPAVMPDRPYRVYRGGQPGGSPDDPDLALPGSAASGAANAVDAPAQGERRGPIVLPPPGSGPPPSAKPSVKSPSGPRRRRPWGRIVGITLLVLLLVTGVWLVIGYLAFRDSVEAANARLERITRAAPVGPVLDQQSGLLLSQPTTILVMGRDRNGLSDSLQLIRVDPDNHLVSTLAIPRDLKVDIPGVGSDKINVAYARGGAALAVETVRAVTGVPVNHVVLIDFSGFRKLVDAVSGIDIYNKERLSSEFDGHTYHFQRGALHLNGARALAYARIRKNADNASDSDVTRGQRQQRVMAALKHKLVSPASLFRLRSVGAHVADPLATDLSANQLLQLGWGDFRAQRHLNCNLGGEPVVLGGVSYLAGVSENRDAISAFLGETAPRARNPKDPFSPGCS
jgi:LCP family protein required for cell wall assembly